jgi:hypothetical protein
MENIYNNKEENNLNSIKININNLNQNNLQYSKNMWLEINKINNNNLAERNKIKSILYVISQKNNFEIEYMENLQKIYHIKNKIFSINENNILNDLYKIFFEEILNEISLHKKNTEIIFNEIIKPLSNLIFDINKITKSLNDDLIVLRNEFKIELENVENYKLKFYNDSKNYENYLIKFEKLKSENNEENFLKKYKEEEENLLKIAKNSEKKYKEIIENANIIRNKYIKSSIEIYNKYQNNDENFYNEIKNFLIKLTTYYISNYNELINSQKKQQNIYNNFNNKIYIQNFIKNNISKFSHPNEIKFLAYISDIPILINNDNYNKNIKNFEIIKKVKNILNTLFLNSNNINNINDNENNLFIENTIVQIWNSNVINNFNDIIDKFDNLFNEKNYRIIFLNNLNKFRANGLFQINKLTYEFLVKVLNLILIKSNKSNDFESIKLSIILSQTFYMINNNNSNNYNKLLQEGIINNNFFKNYDFWKNLIDYSILNDMCNNKEYLVYLEENEEMKKKRIYSMVFGNLITFWFNMKNFNFNLENGKNLIKEFCETYEIKLEDIIDEENINKIVNEEGEGNDTTTNSENNLILKTSLENIIENNNHDNNKEN